MCVCVCPCVCLCVCVPRHSAGGPSACALAVASHLTLTLTLTLTHLQRELEDDPLLAARYNVRRLTVHLLHSRHPQLCGQRAGGGGGGEGLVRCGERGQRGALGGERERERGEQLLS